MLHGQQNVKSRIPVCNLNTILPVSSSRSVHKTHSDTRVFMKRVCTVVSETICRLVYVSQVYTTYRAL